MITPNVTDICDIREAGALVGLCLGCIFFGVHLTVAGTTMHWMMREKKHKYRSSTPHIETNLLNWYIANGLFILVLFLLASTVAGLTMASCIAPNEYSLAGGIPVALITLTVVVSIACMSFLLFRCWIIWGRNNLIMVVPILLLISALVLGLYTADMFPNKAKVTFFNFLCLSISLNILTTFLIVLKIASARRAIKTLAAHGQSFSKSELLLAGKRYTSIIAFLIESATLYTITAAIALGISHSFPQVQFLFSHVVVQAECVSAELIILRAITGRAWSTSTVANARWMTTTYDDNHSQLDHTGRARSTVEFSRRASSRLPRRSRSSSLRFNRGVVAPVSRDNIFHKTSSTARSPTVYDYSSSSTSACGPSPRDVIGLRITSHGVLSPRRNGVSNPIFDESSSSYDVSSKESDPPTFRMKGIPVMVPPVLLRDKDVESDYAMRSLYRTSREASSITIV